VRPPSGTPDSAPAPAAPLDPGEFSAAVTAVTSAFGDPTRRQIYLYAHEQADGVTAADVAAQFDLHPNVARHHLEKLAGGGYLEVHVGKAPQSGAGRPSKRYRVVEKDMALDFHVKRGDLILTLLGRALSLLPPEQARLMAEEVGEEYGRALAGAMAPEQGQRSFRAALHAVADALTAHGFAAHTEERGRTMLLVSEHCPFGDTAVKHPVMCAVDRGLVRGMLSSLYGEDPPSELASSRPQGDEVCVTTF
jgi:predicted ArsR family transcriptional regulator